MQIFLVGCMAISPDLFKVDAFPTSVIPLVVVLEIVMVIRLQ